MQFYENLRSFKKFDDFTEDSHFRQLPDDWSVIITDIKGSTSAIAEGRYKDVNTIGAATIVVARKALAGKDFPFVFGGDGATLLAPTEKVDGILKGLCLLRNLAKNNHGLELRIGVVKMSELKSLAAPVEVAKFEITAGRSVAILRGAGIPMAEKLIKGSSEKYLAKLDAEGAPDLSGLSCRWSPIPSRNGKILSLIVLTRKDKKIYTDFLEKLGKIIPKGLESSNPVNVDLASVNSVYKNIQSESKLYPTVYSLKFSLKVVEIIMTTLVFRFNFLSMIFNSETYKNSLRPHSDFRKFDETLRMVIDCTPEQVAQITQYLSAELQVGNLFYGEFQTDSSIMTCFVDALGQGQHIHFIDADNGGYAAAAIGLKKQMQEKDKISVS